jgi:hypothetical protein
MAVGVGCRRAASGGLLQEGCFRRAASGGLLQEGCFRRAASAAFFLALNLNIKKVLFKFI